MSKCWYCNNELTSGDSPKHFGICNKCYDKMFKSGDTIIRSLTNKISDLEAKLAESEKSKESYRLQNEQHHLQLLQFYSRLGVEAFGADIHEKALETLMIMKEQLVITEKALELACEDIIGSCEYCSYNTMPECPIEADCLDEKINYFKAKAKEMLENE